MTCTLSGGSSSPGGAGFLGSHLCAQLRHYKKDPVQTTKTSIIGAINMLGLASSRPRPVRFMEIPRFTRSRETIWAMSILSARGLVTTRGKRCAATFFDYWRQHRLPIKVARIFNTYGPSTHPNHGRVVSSFIVQALLNHDITVFGEGLQHDPSATSTT